MQFMYLVVNEFVWHNMTGVYLNLLFCAYGHFLTFCIVMDSCLSKQDNDQGHAANLLNKAGRIFFHLFFVGCLGLTYFARSCEDRLYPFAFCVVGIFILATQVFDLVFYW
mmetsp:Transcript_33167/g.39035  ORF Transcript_33167/g.39035 Transcript_33167/m.39035 type:complete len:110 (-) Transcript_33167:732-1061(-)